MDVAHQGLECRLGRYQGRPVTALEEMTAAAILSVKPASVSKQEVVGDMRQRFVGDFDGHMDVVGHPAIGVVAMPEALDAVAQEPLEGPSITLGQEDRLAVVTASDEVIEGSTVVLSRFPSHTLEDAKRSPELASCRPGTLRSRRRETNS